MEAEAIDTLVNEAKFPLSVALGVVKAIDMVIARSDLLTVAKFKELSAESEAKLNERFAAVDQRFASIEVRFAELRAEFKSDLKELEVRVVRWVFLTMLGNVALSMAARVIMH